MNGPSYEPQPAAWHADRASSYLQHAEAMLERMDSDETERLADEFLRLALTHATVAQALEAVR